MGGSADDDVWLVGDGNTVLHWDGERWMDLHGVLRGLDLYSVWSSGPNDAWVAGDAGVTFRYNPDEPLIAYTRHLNQGGGAILHFDGKGWKADPQIGKRWAHAIWGADATHVFALLEDGDVGRFDGKSWTITQAPASAVLRDVWGTSATDVWAVGDGGTIEHFDGTSWTTVAHGSGDPKTDPAASKNVYYGVWGASANDVWAVFRDSSHPDLPPHYEQSIGFAHWNGVAWTVAQTMVAPGSGRFAPKTHEPIRFGHQLWGGDGRRVLAMSFNTMAPLVFDGTTWSADDTLATSGIRTLWGRPGIGALFGAGEGGALFRFDGVAPESRLTPMFSGFRESIRSLVSVGAEVWGIAVNGSLMMFQDTDTMGSLVRWTLGGWSHVRLHAKQADGRSCEVAVGSVAAAAADDVWVSGAHATSCLPLPMELFTEKTPDVIHWDGAAWTAAALPEQEGSSFIDEGLSAHMWIPKGGKSPWLIGRTGLLYRLTGTTWTQFSLPDGLRAYAVGGSSDDDVWITASRGATPDDDAAIFHLEGNSFKEVHRVSGSAWRSAIVATSPNDVWIRVDPLYIRPPMGMLHWDGRSWTDRVDLNARQLWPVGDGKAYFIRNDDEGADRTFPLADSRYVLGYWDGVKETVLGETSATIRSLAATQDALWLAGKGGATLRYPFPKSPR
jgi:hypothetical protein